MNWTAKDLKNKGIAEVDGTYKKLVAEKPAKVKKLPNLLERALQQEEPGNSVLGECGAKIFIKPLSINKAYYGKLTKTDNHRRYIEAATLLLPNNIVIPEGELKMFCEFGFSSRASDFDNPIKTFLDLLAHKYGFNDKMIMEATIRKSIVKKGKEFIKFNIEKFQSNNN